MRIIVYGSLRRKQGNSHWMTDAQLLGEHDLEGFDMYNLGHYPAVVPGDGTVHCEVYRINSSIMNELDELKSNTKDYRRELIQTPYGSAWIYLYRLPIEGLPRIHSGDWLKRNEENENPQS
ncbi:gamma-glutamylcyclotransferase family protein [Yersinia kristensenii]|uniref:gamma-glutamylcyclotransferase family protein n=1 Tax=Yersinia kristensenii TaxID=28152 RepID=UPI0001A5459B|nr:gamma-glutamylcyclotransferase [Yersinia kristensenii]EEP92597.1 AIG2 family protein [Yersinia kristensenii ATCC 33638]PEH53939.1 gamma-glutamylcyclotransferase [Yersinia kristensenii]SUP67748.1 AIG2 family protein [Yersinia kristensenii]